MYTCVKLRIWKYMCMFIKYLWVWEERTYQFVTQLNGSFLVRRFVTGTASTEDTDPLESWFCLFHISHFSFFLSLELKSWFLWLLWWMRPHFGIVLVFIYVEEKEENTNANAIPMPTPFINYYSSFVSVFFILLLSANN